MPKILTEQGFEFWIYTNDHPPPHSHVIRGRRSGKGRKEELLIYLGDQLTPPSIREIRGMKKNDVRKAMEIAIRKQADLLTAWRYYYEQ